VKLGKAKITQRQHIGQWSRGKGPRKSARGDSLGTQTEKVLRRSEKDDQNEEIPEGRELRTKEHAWWSDKAVRPYPVKK